MGSAKASPQAGTGVACVSARKATWLENRWDAERQVCGQGCNSGGIMLGLESQDKGPGSHFKGDRATLEGCEQGSDVIKHTFSLWLLWGTWVVGQE